MIHVQNLTVRAGSFALSGLTFEVPAGLYAVLMGDTGCGKTTLLETICGLRTVLGGKIELAGVDVTQAKAAERGIGYVPQDTALFTSMTVRKNMAFPLSVRRWPTAAVKTRVDELAELLGISGLLDRSTHNLSGGERQRVALGRALAFRPQVLLLDEPLSALDESTKAQMHELLKRVQRHEHVTALHVTHSSAEAVRLADRRWLLSEGRLIEQNGLPAPNAAGPKHSLGVVPAPDQDQTFHDPNERTHGDAPGERRSP